MLYLEDFILIFYSMLSGFLTALSFGAKSLAPLVLIAQIPMFVVYFKENNPDNLPKIIKWYTFSYFLFLVLWIYRLREIAPIPLLLFGIVAIAICLSFLYWVMFRLFQPKKLWEIALCFLLAELVPTLFGTMSFTWGRLGTILAPVLPLVQSASIFGTAGISLMIITINLLLAKGWVEKNKTYALLALGILTVQGTYGIIILHQPLPTENPISVIGLQGGMGSLSKWEAGINETIDHYKSLSQTAIEKNPDLIILPETAIPTLLTEKILNEFSSMGKNTNTEFLIGGFIQDGDTQYNTLIHPETLMRYDKRKLVPFGEFVPFDWLFGHENAISAGKDTSLIPTQIGTIGSLICYDTTFPSFTRKSVQEGAEFLVVASNDSWFEHTPALYQHHNHSILRSIESHRYLVRSANTGISSIINPHGAIIDTIPAYETGMVEGEIYGLTNETFYVRFGEWVSWLSLLLLLHSKYTKKNKSYGNAS